ncbi:MAG: hypothetical protein JO251_17895 [Verrucomicrobia bacterium]|nr:hypothetical protein [Verrucomicrobiota bacterium]MBV8417081.1 hypothetical protein [Verrucomicrobiota bacterium]
MNEDNLDRLFAKARRAGAEQTPSLPQGFAEGVLQQHRHRVQEERAFLRASMLSIATALIILGAVLGINLGTTSLAGSDDQESTVEMAYALWDPVGN